MSDLISRADAIKPFCIAPDGTRIPEVDCDKFPVEFSVEFIKKHLLSLPSAEPKTGKWVEYGMNTDGTHNIKCNQCGAGFRTRGHANSHNTKERFKWCPTCGADMRGEQNG